VPEAIRALAWELKVLVTRASFEIGVVLCRRATDAGTAERMN